MIDIRTSDDVTTDREQRERDEFKKKTVKDIGDVFEEIFPKKVRKEVKKKFSLFKWLGGFLLLLLLLNFILGNIWLLKTLIKSLFF